MNDIYENQAYYTRKTSYKHIKVIIDPEVYTHKVTMFENLLHLIRRLSNSYTLDEKYLIESRCKTTMDFFLKDGAKGKYMALHKMSQLLKEWKQNHSFDFNQDEYNILMQQTQRGIAELHPAVSQETRPPKARTSSKQSQLSANMTVNYSSNITTLPMLNCLIQDSNKIFHHMQLTIDTAASCSIISLKRFKELGLTEDLLDKKYSFPVATAAGRVQSAGLYKAVIYLKTDKGQWYKCGVTFLVLKSNHLDRVLLGLNDLRGSSYTLSYNENTGTEQLQLYVLTANNTKRKRTFSTFNLRDRKPRTMFTNESRAEFLGKRSVNMMFVAEDVKFDRDVVVQPLHGEVYLTQPHVLLSNVKAQITSTTTSSGEDWPTAVKYLTEVEVNYLGEKSWPAGQLTLEGVQPEEPNPTENLECLFDQVMEGVDGLTQTEEDPGPILMDDVDETIFKRIGSLDHESEPVQPGKPYWMPNLDAVPEEFRPRFEELFTRHKAAFTPDKFSIPKSRLPPAKIDLKPDAVPQNCKPRPFSPEHKVLIRSYIDRMHKAGFIRKVEPENVSGWCHPIHLVMKKDGYTAGGTVLTNMSKEERMEHLKKSSRFISDLRGLNSQCQPPSPITLSTFEDELVLFGDRTVSQADITLGFYAIVLDESSRGLTQFSFEHEVWEYEVMPMGGLKSPGSFNIRLGIVFNKDNFDAYFANQQALVLNQLCFFTSFSRYIDDCSLLGKRYCFYTQWHLWDWFLTQCVKWGICLSSNKVTVGQTKIDLLGYEVNLGDGTYRLSASRQRSFQKMAIPDNMSKVKSFLATQAYFDKATLFSRSLCTLLHILSNEKEVFHFTLSHLKEFRMIIFSYELNLKLKIIDYEKPIFLSTDASWSSMAASLWQLRASQETDGDQGSGDQTASQDPTSRFELCAVMSRSFNTQSLNHSPLAKELVALFSALEAWRMHIFRAQAGVLALVDISALTLVPKLKYTSSKMMRYNLLLQNTPNLSILNTKSANLNFFSDLLSRCTAPLLKDAPELVPARFLDSPGPGYKPLTYLSPERVQYLAQVSMPSLYTDIPERKAQCPVEINEQFLEQMIERGTIPEQEVMKGIYWGHSSIPADSLMFRNEKTGKIIPKTAFDQMSKKYNFPKVKSYIYYIRKHSFCLNSSHDYLKQIKTFLNFIYEFMKSRGLDTVEPTLYHYVLNAMRDEDYTVGKFVKLHEALMKSRLYDNDHQMEEFVHGNFIPLYQHTSSEVELRKRKNNLLIILNKSKRLLPGTMTCIPLRIKLCTSLGLENVFNEESFVHHLTKLYTAQEYYYLNLLCYNQTDNDIVLSKGQVLFTIKPCFLEKCTCQSDDPDPDQVQYILARQDNFSNEERNQEFKVLISQLVEREALTSGPSKGDTFPDDGPQLGKEDDLTADTEESAGWLKQHQDKVKTKYTPEVIKQIEDQGEMTIDEEKDHHTVNHELEEVTESVASQSAKKDEVTKSVDDQQHINRLIFLSVCYGDHDTRFTTDFIKSLQESDSQLVKLKELVKLNKAKDFVLKKEVLYKVTKKYDTDRIQLCLSPEIMKTVIESVHNACRHYSDAVMFEYINQYFWSKDLSKLIAEARESCPVCLFNKPSVRKSYTQNSHVGARLINQELVIDAMEDLPRCCKGNKYLLIVVDTATGFTRFYPLKALTGEEARGAMESWCLSYGIPQIIKSDQAKMFASKPFQEFLKENRIKALSWSPLRSPAQGLSETTIKLTRRHLATILLHKGENSHLTWCTHILSLTNTFNNIIFMANDNHLSRHYLFFGPLAYRRTLDMVSVDDLDDGVLLDQQVLGLNRIHKARLRFREKYKLNKTLFRQGSLVVLPRTKAERALQAGNSAVASTCRSVYRVLSINPNSIRLKCLRTRDEQSRPFSHCTPVELTQMRYTRRGDLVSSPFWENLFKYGSPRGPLFEQIQRDEDDLARVAASQSWEPNTEDDTHRVVHQDAPDAEAPDYQRETLEEEYQRLESLAKEQARNIDQLPREVSDELADTLKKHPYHLRSRKPTMKANLIDLDSLHWEKKHLCFLVSEIMLQPIIKPVSVYDERDNTQPKKSIRFNDQLLQVYFRPNSRLYTKHGKPTFYQPEFLPVSFNNFHEPIFLSPPPVSKERSQREKSLLQELTDYSALLSYLRIQDQIETEDCF